MAVAAAVERKMSRRLCLNAEPLMGVVISVSSKCGLSERASSGVISSDAAEILTTVPVGIGFILAPTDATRQSVSLSICPVERLTQRFVLFFLLNCINHTCILTFALLRPVAYWTKIVLTENSGLLETEENKRGRSRRKTRPQLRDWNKL
jgi:hypothetical protein